MEFASIASRYRQRFIARHGRSTSEAQWSALNAIVGCRSGQYGEVLLSCNTCSGQMTHPRSCGHRSCNQCQHHCTTQWVHRQQRKLLPVDYFMITFTLPYELREFTRLNQKQIYSTLFQCAVSTIRDFGLNDNGFAAELAMTAVLHTHTRRLDYHPHIHLVVPGGGVNKKRREWRKIVGNGKYLFNTFNLATVFRGRFLAALHNSGLKAPQAPPKWVAQVQHVGKGLPALKYLSRYLYRGVINNRNILTDDGTNVRFQYKDSKTGALKTRTMPGEDFVQLVLQHTLPKGFRRIRDYGFLHGNARKTLRIVQWVLRVAIPAIPKPVRPSFICKACRMPMSIVGFRRARPAPG